MLLDAITQISLEELLGAANDISALCNVAVDHLIGISSKDVKSYNEVKPLIAIFSQCYRLKLTDAEFDSVVDLLKVDESCAHLLKTFYAANRKRIVEAMSLRGYSEFIPHYYDFNWRFETIVASRALLNQVSPQIKLGLQLKRRDENNFENIEFQTDVVSLHKVIGSIDEALKEAKGQHLRRVQRHIK